MPKKDALMEGMEAMYSFVSATCLTPVEEGVLQGDVDAVVVKATLRILCKAMENAMTQGGDADVEKFKTVFSETFFEGSKRFVEGALV